MDEDTARHDALPWTHPLRHAELASRKPTHFDIAPDAEARARIAQWLDISSVKGLRLKGTMTPIGRTDWALKAAFTATIVQPCVVTLAPVTTKLTESVERHYVAGLAEPDAAEMEMSEDTSTERLPPVIDLGAIALETLELAMPGYPRADGDVAMDTSKPEPEFSDTKKPFAALSELLQKKPQE